MATNALLKLPKYFDHNQFDALLNQERQLFNEIRGNPQDIVFDLSETEFISTLAVLLIAQISDNFIAGGHKCLVQYGKPKKESLTAWLFGVMGLVKDENDKEVQSYLDTFRVGIKRCHNGKESLDAVNKLIPIIRSEIKPSENVLRALNWALWEIVDNAGTHGYGTYDDMQSNYPRPVYFCAFSYKDVMIDIAILDSGQGIHKSFLTSGKEKYRNITNEDALKLSIQNSESGHPKGSPGFGLYGCAEMAKQSDGKLMIISGENKLIRSKESVDILSSSGYDGTMVSLRIPKQAAVNLESIFGKDSNIVLESIDDLFGSV